MFKFFFIFLVLLTAAQAGGQNAMAEGGIKLKIIAVGDSTTAGTPLFYSPAEAPPRGQGDEKSQYAYWIMKKHPDWEVANRGVRGQRSDQISARFRRELVPPLPDIAVVLAGVNDIYQGYDTEHVKANLRNIYDLSSSRGLKVVACTVLPYDSAAEEKKKIIEVNAWIRSEARSRGFLFCDTYATVNNPKKPGTLSGTPDGIHPDIAGYRAMGEAIAGVIESSSA